MALTNSAVVKIVKELTVSVWKKQKTSLTVLQNQLKKVFDKATAEDLKAVYRSWCRSWNQLNFSKNKYRVGDHSPAFYFHLYNFFCITFYSPVHPKSIYEVFSFSAIALASVLLYSCNSSESKTGLPTKISWIKPGWIQRLNRRWFLRICEWELV